jgi:hypothetical protein
MFFHVTKPPTGPRVGLFETWNGTSLSDKMQRQLGRCLWQKDQMEWQYLWIHQNMIVFLVFDGKNPIFASIHVCLSDLHNQHSMHNDKRFFEFSTSWFCRHLEQCRFPMSF